MANLSKYNKMNVSELAEERRKLAKRANQRMVRLEQAGLDKFAYKKAQSYLYGMGRKRFSESRKATDIYHERRELAELEKFLNSVSSTPSGLEKKYKNAYKTLKSNFNLENLTFSDYLEVLESEAWQKGSGGSLGSMGTWKAVDYLLSKGSLDKFIDKIESDITLKGAMNISVKSKSEQKGQKN